MHFSEEKKAPLDRVGRKVKKNYFFLGKKKLSACLKRNSSRHTTIDGGASNITNVGNEGYYTFPHFLTLIRSCCISHMPGYTYFINKNDFFHSSIIFSDT